MIFLNAIKMSDGPNRVIDFAKFKYAKNDLFD